MRYTAAKFQIQQAQTEIKAQSQHNRKMILYRLIDKCCQEPNGKSLLIKKAEEFLFALFKIAKKSILIR
jgi:hypothetical protein